MAATVNNNNNKRQRMIITANNFHITDLPVGFLVDVAAYLSKSSRAMFAVAMTAPSVSWCDVNNSEKEGPSDITKALTLSTQWDILDFGDDITDERYLSEKLKDEDIGAILTCINAKATLKILKLTGCNKVEGYGLVPLRGSVVLEQIDLSIVGEYINPKHEIGSLSVDYCIPILDGIIDANGCSLQHIQFPQKWRKRKFCFVGDGLVSKQLLFNGFLRKYNQFLINRMISCSRCSMGMGMYKWIDMVDGYQLNTCYSCRKCFCKHCEDETGEEFLRHCEISKKSYCSDCVSESNWVQCEYCVCKWRNGCGVLSCQLGSGCITSVGDSLVCPRCLDGCVCGCNVCPACLIECMYCRNSYCIDCAQDIECTNCQDVICANCSDGDIYCVKYCDECDSILCSSCRAGGAK